MHCLRCGCSWPRARSRGSSRVESPGRRCRRGGVEHAGSKRDHRTRTGRRRQNRRPRSQGGRAWVPPSLDNPKREPVPRAALTRRMLSMTDLGRHQVLSGWASMSGLCGSVTRDWARSMHLDTQRMGFVRGPTSGRSSGVGVPKHQSPGTHGLGRDLDSFRDFRFKRRRARYDKLPIGAR